MPDDFWKEADVISSYSRHQAIIDAVLVDITAEAVEAGFKCPVAVTSALWDIIQNIPPRFIGIQDVKGRLWDVLTMARLAAKDGGIETQFELTLHHDRKTYQTLKMVAGPGDEGEMVITIMLPNED